MTLRDDIFGSRDITLEILGCVSRLLNIECPQDCECIKCQNKRTLERLGAISTEGGIVIVLKADHHDEVEELLHIREELSLQNDTRIWREIFLKEDASLFEELSLHGKDGFKSMREKLILYLEHMPFQFKEKAQLLSRLKACEDDISVVTILASKSNFESSAIKDIIAPVKDELIGDRLTQEEMLEMETRLSELEATLQKDLQDLKEPPMIKVPFVDMERLMTEYATKSE